MATPIVGEIFSVSPTPQPPNCMDYLFKDGHHEFCLFLYAFCHEELATESFHFLFETERFFSTWPHNSDKKNLENLKHLFNEYIERERKQTINISSKMRAEIIELFNPDKKAKIDIIQEKLGVVKLEIQMLLLDNMSRFCNKVNENRKKGYSSGKTLTYYTSANIHTCSFKEEHFPYLQFLFSQQNKKQKKKLSRIWKNASNATPTYKEIANKYYKRLLKNVHPDNKKRNPFKPNAKDFKDAILHAFENIGNKGYYKKTAPKKTITNSKKWPFKGHK